MPYRPPRVCPKCNRLITGRRCVCSRSDGHYGGTSQGRRLREIKLANDPMCQWNTPTPGVGRSPECNRPADEVDHIKPVEERPDLRYVYGNLQSLCHDHHTEKTLREREQRKQRVY